MERFALAGLLAVAVPSFALAQRVEVSGFGAAYTPVNRVQTTGHIVDCFTDPCPFFYRRVTRTSGLAWGARFGAQLTNRVGIDAAVQRVNLTHRVSADGGWSSAPEQVGITFVTVQPRLRLHVDDRVQGFVAGGPALVFVEALAATPATSATQPGLEVGLAFSAALRVPVFRMFDVELRASDYVYVSHAPAAELQHDLVYGLGLTLLTGARPPGEPLGQGPGWLARLAARTTITPAVGAYLAVARPAQWTVPDSVFGPTNGETHRMTIEPGVSTGFRVAVQSASWWGLEASFATAGVTRRDEASMSPTAVLENPAPAPLERALGRNSVGALRLTTTARFATWGDATVAAGPALVVVTRDWMRWDQFRPLVDDHIWGASLGATVGITPTPATRLELGITDHMYALRYDARNPRTTETSFLQHDLVITAGAALKVGRWDPIVLPAVSLPAPRSEIALFGGAYRPAAFVWEGATGIECDAEPCPYHFRDVRRAGTAYGGRVTLFFNARLGLDFTLQHTKNTATRTLRQSPGTPTLDQFDRHETTTFFAVQPRRQFELADGVHATFALGPAFGNVTTPWGASDGTLGVAGSVAVQIQIVRAIGLEMRGSGVHAMGRGLDDNRTHLTASVGLALAVIP